MTLEELCAVALSKGADVSYDEVVNSASYLARCKALTEVRENATSTLSVWQAGVHNFGIALQQAQLRDRQALKRLVEAGSFRPSASSQALVWELGDRLIARAVQELPPIVRATALGWRKLSAGDQLQVFRQLRQYLLPKSSLIRLHERGKEERALGDHAEFAPMFAEYSQDSFLPARFGSLGENSPSCLGMSIMLAAFARESRARFLYYTLVDDINERSDRLVGAIYGGLFKQARKHQVKDRGLLRRLKRASKQARVQALAVQDWHHAILIELADGSWLNFDPYLENIIPVVSAFQVKEAYRLLTKYGQVLPGLCLQLSDGGLVDETYGEQAELAEHVLGVARNFHQRVESDDFLTVESLIGSWEMDFLNELIRFSSGGGAEARPWTPEIVVKYWTPARLNDSEIDQEAELNTYHDSAEARRERLLYLESQFYRYHSLILETKVNRLRQLLSHPVVDVMLSGPGIGLAVLSNLVSRSPDINPKFPLAAELVCQSNSQMLWHEMAACQDEQEVWSEEQQMVMATAKEAVLALPALNERTQIRLKSKSTRPRRAIAWAG